MASLLRIPGSSALTCPGVKSSLLLSTVEACPPRSVPAGVGVSRFLSVQVSCSGSGNVNVDSSSGVGPSPGEKPSSKPKRSTQSGLGFGSQPAPPKKENLGRKSKSGERRRSKEGSLVEEREVDRVLSNIERQELARGKKASRVDVGGRDGEGRVDYVRVDNWSGTSNEVDLENLRMRSFSSSFSALDPNIPFYQRLVTQLQLLDSKGELVSPQGGPPLPPFERWNFHAEDYLRYLMDQHLVHSSIDDAIQSVAAFNRRAEDGGFRKDEPPAFSVFTDKLSRSKALESDITALKRKLQNSGSHADSMKPSSHASAYAKYIAWLSQQATSDDKLEAPLLEKNGTTDGLTAQSQLFAHIFSLHVAHLTTGMRIGAKSVSLLKEVLVPDIMAFYRDYPPMAKNPLAVFVEGVNGLGAMFDRKEELDPVLEELPRAVEKTSLLLTPLAVERKP